MKIVSFKESCNDNLFIVQEGREDDEDDTSTRYALFSPSFSHFLKKRTPIGSRRNSICKVEDEINIFISKIIKIQRRIRRSSTQKLAKIKKEIKEQNGGI
jgi:hypothetical protein